MQLCQLFLLMVIMRRHLKHYFTLFRHPLLIYIYISFCSDIYRDCLKQKKIVCCIGNDHLLCICWLQVRNRNIAESDTHRDYHLMHWDYCPCRNSHELSGFIIGCTLYRWLQSIAFDSWPLAYIMIGHLVSQFSDGRQSNWGLLI